MVIRLHRQASQRDVRSLQEENSQSRSAISSLLRSAIVPLAAVSLVTPMAVTSSVSAATMGPTLPKTTSPSTIDICAITVPSYGLLQFNIPNSQLPATIVFAAQTSTSSAMETVIVKATKTMALKYENGILSQTASIRKGRALVFPISEARIYYMGIYAGAMTSQQIFAFTIGGLKYMLEGDRQKAREHWPLSRTSLKGCKKFTMADANGYNVSIQVGRISLSKLGITT